MENVLQKLTKADQWLAEAKTFDDLKQIHDIAIAAEAYAQAHRLGISAENHAREIKFIAARRIGELVPKETGGRGKKTIQTSNSFPTPPRLTEFRKLAEIPESEFKEKIENLKKKEEKITYNKMLQSKKTTEPQKEKPIYSDTEFPETSALKEGQSRNLGLLKDAWLRANKEDRKRFLKWLQKRDELKISKRRK
jgi:hypothetical protein